MERRWACKKPHKQAGGRNGKRQWPICSFYALKSTGSSSLSPTSLSSSSNGDLAKTSYRLAVANEAHAGGRGWEGFPM